MGSIPTTGFITFQDVIYILAKLPELTIENYIHFLDSNVLNHDHKDYNQTKKELHAKLQTFLANSSALQEFEIFHKFDAAFQLLTLDEGTIRRLFENLYTEMSGTNLQIPHEAKLLFSSLAQQCEQVVWYHYYLKLNNFRLTHCPHMSIEDFSYYMVEDFHNVARIMAENYDTQMYTRNRIRKINLANPPNHFVEENFGPSRTKLKTHLTIYSDAYYSPNIPNNVIITRTGSIPYSCTGTASNYVISDKTHHLNPTSLIFDDPNLTFWHIYSKYTSEYNEIVLDPALDDWRELYKSTTYFTRLYLPFDVYIVTLESLLNSNHPHLSNPSNLLNNSLQALDFWKNHTQQFNSSLPIKLNINAHDSLCTIQRNQIFKVRLKSASWLEATCKLMAQSPGRIRLR